MVLLFSLSQQMKFWKSFQTTLPFACVMGGGELGTSLYLSLSSRLVGFIQSAARYPHLAPESFFFPFSARIFLPIAFFLFLYQVVGFLF